MADFSYVDYVVSQVRKRFADLAPHTHTEDEGKACIMELITWAAGEDWSSYPTCVAEDVTHICKLLHDNADPKWYPVLWTDDRLRRMLSVRQDAPSVVRRYRASVEHIRPFALEKLRNHGIDTRPLEQRPPVTTYDTYRQFVFAVEAATAGSTLNWLRLFPLPAQTQTVRLQVLDLWLQDTEF